jgi:hypothetical protein
LSDFPVSENVVCSSLCQSAIFDRARGHALRWRAVAGILRRLDGRYVVPVGTIRTGFIILAQSFYRTHRVFSNIWDYILPLTTIHCPQDPNPPISNEIKRLEYSPD